MSKSTTRPTVSNADLPPEITWLADCPLFIDEYQITRFHDAIVQPNGQIVQELISRSKSKKDEDKKTFKIGGSAEVNPASLLGSLGSVFSFFKITGSADITQTRGTDKSDTRSLQAEIQYVYTAQRRLIELTVHYILNQPSRLKLVKEVESKDWRDPEFIGMVPRGLIFLDLPVKSMLVPLAMELSSGEIKLVYEELKGKDGMENPPKYPEPSDGISDSDLLQKRKEYWSWYQKNFNATKAMLKVEELSKNSRIRWIDYRLPIGTDGDTLHLRAWARGEYDNGVFAYNLIKRGFKHGLRLVGTIKQEPDLNLLAVFEK
jgi:hypothetical protein